MTETTSGFQKIGAFTLETDSVQKAYATIIDRLAIQYCLQQPDKSVSDFHEEILKPISDGVPGAKLTLTYGADHSKYTLSAFMNLLLKSCDLCKQACEADSAGNQALAWRYVGNAMYYLGMLEAMSILEPAIHHIITERSASGAKKRTEKYAPLRELARELASKRTHMTKRGAVFAVMEDVLAEAKRIGVTLSETQTERTITTWLEGMSFGSKRKP